MIKINKTKREAAEEIFELLENKLLNNYDVEIGINVAENGNGEIDSGFDCMNDSPEYTIIGQHFSEEDLGDVPPVAEWDEEIRNAIIDMISDTWFNNLVDINGEPETIIFAGNKYFIDVFVDGKRYIAHYNNHCSRYQAEPDAPDSVEQRIQEMYETGELE